MKKIMMVAGYLILSCSMSMAMESTDEDGATGLGCPMIVEELFVQPQEPVTFERAIYSNGETVTCIDKTKKTSWFDWRDKFLFVGTFFIFVGLEYAFKCYVNGEVTVSK